MSHKTPNPTSRASRCRGAVGVELLAGLVAALICGALWVVVAHYSGQELIYLTLAIGVVVGVTISATAKVRSLDTGISAAGLTAIVVLLGKLLILQWSINAAPSTAAPQPVATSAPSHQTESATTTEQAATTEAATEAPSAPGSTIKTDISEAPRSYWIKTALSNTDLLWVVLAMALAFIIGKGMTAKSPPSNDNDATTSSSEQETTPAEN